MDEDTTCKITAMSTFRLSFIMPVDSILHVVVTGVQALTCTDTREIRIRLY